MIRLALQRRRSQSPASPRATRKTAGLTHCASGAGWSSALPRSQRRRAVSIHQAMSEMARRHRRGLPVTG
ncbi:hypothetical protein TN53_12110 [Streptomyces sp. WM6386]|nr:hypothetical protein TN53_12110 [Streptomyces sp. WM6386]